MCYKINVMSEITTNMHVKYNALTVLLREMLPYNVALFLSQPFVY